LVGREGEHISMPFRIREDVSSLKSKKRSNTVDIMLDGQEDASFLLGELREHVAALESLACERDRSQQSTAKKLSKDIDALRSTVDALRSSLEAEKERSERLASQLKEAESVTADLERRHRAQIDQLEASVSKRVANAIKGAFCGEKL